MNSDPNIYIQVQIHCGNQEEEGMQEKFDGEGSVSSIYQIERTGDPAQDRCSFEYQGIHDHGDLPEMQVGGPFAQMILALQVGYRYYFFCSVPISS